MKQGKPKTKEEKQKEIEGLLLKVKLLGEIPQNAILNRFKAVSPVYRVTYLKSVLKMLSPRKSIRLQCAECMGYCDNARDEIKNCSAFGCPLWNHRPYQTKKSKPLTNSQAQV